MFFLGSRTGHCEFFFPRLLHSAADHPKRPVIFEFLWKMLRVSGKKNENAKWRYFENAIELKKKKTTAESSAVGVRRTRNN